MEEYVKSNTVSDWLNEVVEHVNKYHTDVHAPESVTNREELVYTWSSRVQMNFYSPLLKEWKTEYFFEAEAYCLQYFEEILNQNIICKSKHKHMEL
jgi:hypothetical protein